MKILDSGFRRNDEKKAFGTFYEIIKFCICLLKSIGFASHME
jgi:hypothetical protein